MLVGGLQRVVILPVHLELAVRVLVVVLIRVPAELQHRVADLADHVVAAHQCLLVVAGLGLMIAGVGDGRAVGADEEELAFDAGLERVALGGGVGDHALQHVARRLLDELAVHVRIGGEPAHLFPPRQLDQTIGIGNGEHVGVGRRHVEPAGKAGKSGPVLGHLADRRRRHELCPHGAEKIDIADEEVLDSLNFCGLSQVRHVLLPTWAHHAPGIQFVPASGTPAMAADSTVSATRSSGSRLCTWLLPQARAMVCVSSVSTER